MRRPKQPLLLLSFMVMPYFDVGPLRHYGKRRVAISLSMLFIAGIVVSSWMGTPAFLVQTTLDQEILFEIAPSEREGMIQRVPYDELILGAYNVDDWQGDLPRSSGLWAVMRRYERLIDEARGIDTPRIWTAERDKQMWAALQG